MASIFNGLHIGYSGLSASQLGINTTSHNITNAETEGYSRQRVVQQSTIPLGTIMPGAQGNGTQVKEIVRIHDEFVFSRFRSESQTKEFSDFQRQTLQELSTYFPEMENVGIKFDMQEYFNLWGDLSINPENQAVKVALAQQTQVLSQDLQQTRTRITDLQSTLNDQLKTSIDEINRIGFQIASLNQAIIETESIAGQHANDLRDQRGVLEVSLSKLVDATIFEGNLTSDMPVSRDIVEKGGNYSVNISGFNVIDGKTFHPIVIDNKLNPNGFYKLSYERQDGILIPMDEALHGGRVGAILDLRGSSFDANGDLQNGQLQEIINQIDGFAAGLVESTNNLYAQGAQEKMTSDTLALEDTNALVNSGLNIKTGTFDIVAYDIDGNIAARRSVTIASTTVMDDSSPTLPNGSANSIIGQLRLSQDDNADGNATNDIDDILNATYINGQLQLTINNIDFAGYTFGIVDNQESGLASGTNFAGAIGISRFFEGDSAKDINLESSLRDDPAKIRANKSPVDGDNTLANDMLQLQFESVSFSANGISTSSNLYGYFDAVVTDVGTRTNAAIARSETAMAKYNAVLQSYESISKVNIDEEMVSLIKYQTAYGASAKIITTIDQMMETLLGLKR
ncbi:MAG: flagellar hook-associated protein FlgK [Campylobacterales bacterium]|nr:flagellar hook-associated protein FlgK [Campylobacterales bacterium]